MLGRGVYGRPWLASALDQGLASGAVVGEPDIETRLGLVLDHFRETLAFYGDRLGVKIFRKHLGWYVEQAPWPTDAAERRAAKARLCRIDSPAEVEAGLKALWLDRGLQAAA
jgi:tRNA-dihydrouridine synthase B